MYVLKTFTAVFFYIFDIFYFYIYIYCRKGNAEFNKLIQTVGHRARFFKNEVKHILCQHF